MGKKSNHSRQINWVWNWFRKKTWFFRIKYISIITSKRYNSSKFPGLARGIPIKKYPEINYFSLQYAVTAFVFLKNTVRNGKYASVEYQKYVTGSAAVRFLKNVTDFHDFLYKFVYVTRHKKIFYSSSYATQQKRFLSLFGEEVGFRFKWGFPYTKNYQRFKNPQHIFFLREFPHIENSNFQDFLSFFINIFCIFF